MRLGWGWSGRTVIAMAGATSVVLAAGMMRASAATGPGARPVPQVGRMLRAPAAPAAPGVAGVPGIPKLGSTNWSGYVQSAKTHGTFTAAEDFWTVPKVTTKAGSQYSADWVGIGGFNDSSLVQDGTEADNVNGTAFYRAWTEILPAPEVVISGLTIHPGDKMEGLVEEIKAGTWAMTVKDLTTGSSGGRTVSYSSSGLSVEAIHERPKVNGIFAALATTTNVTFDPGSFSTAAPGSPSFKPLLKPATGATLKELFMVNNAGTKIIAAPSAADSDGDGFAVADGSTSPPPPAT
jgi:hypothetical protein